ncbi:MAG: CotH kinase family protein, partial [Acidobacteria bacterium]|nr:CotH kinase family protein [Acidobacteriota bacterium]
MTGRKHTRVIRSALLVVLLSIFAGAPAGAICLLPNEPFQVLDFHLDIDPADWDAIRHDTTFNDERSAMFHCGDEIPGLVSVRRKPTIAIPSEADPRKVSLKIDLDEFVLGQEWNSHRKFNLENGGPGALVREGVAWLLMARAGVITSGATWVRLHVNGEVIGIYIRAEQIDKAFLRRHLNEDLGFL